MEENDSVPAWFSADQCSSEVKCSFGELEEEPSYPCPWWESWEMQA